MDPACLPGWPYLGNPDPQGCPNTPSTNKSRSWIPGSSPPQVPRHSRSTSPNLFGQGGFNPSSKPPQTDIYWCSEHLRPSSRKPRPPPGRRALPQPPPHPLGRVVDPKRPVCLVTAGGPKGRPFRDLRPAARLRRNEAHPAPGGQPRPTRCGRGEGCPGSPASAPSGPRRPPRRPPGPVGPSRTARQRRHGKRECPGTVRNGPGHPLQLLRRSARPYASFVRFGPAPPAACSIGGTSGSADFSSPRKVNFLASPSPSVPTTTM